MHPRRDRFDRERRFPAQPRPDRRFLGVILSALLQVRLAPPTATQLLHLYPLRPRLRRLPMQFPRMMLPKATYTPGPPAVNPIINQYMGDLFRKYSVLTPSQELKRRRMLN